MVLVIQKGAVLLRIIFKSIKKKGSLCTGEPLTQERSSLILIFCSSAKPLYGYRMAFGIQKGAVSLRIIFTKHKKKGSLVYKGNVHKVNLVSLPVVNVKLRRRR